jgi:hypothetical protein
MTTNENSNATYSVLVGNLGWVLQDCTDYDKAKKDFDDYVTISKIDTQHRGYQEQVTLWKRTDGDEEPIDEYEPESDIPEMSLPGDDETIVAVLLTRTKDNKKAEEYLCFDCEMRRNTPYPKNQADYLETAESFQYATGIVHEFLTEKYDMLWSENGDLFIGQKCENCHAHLGGWQECKCGDISWPDDTHVCTLSESDPEEWEAVMNGFSTGYVED